MKVLSIILTSSKYKLLLRCIDSVINQYPVNFEYDVVINVNTKNEEYFKKVSEEIPNLYKNYNLIIIRTESNGYPGKGHNSCLNIFKTNKQYDYLLMIDGDDMYYPCAFQRFEKFLNKYPNMDLLHMMLNDRVHFSNEECYNFITNNKNMLGQWGSETFGMGTILGSWLEHYKSWRNLKFSPILIVMSSG